jgi:hypothetical protein
MRLPVAVRVAQPHRQDAPVPVDVLCLQAVLACRQ